MAPEYVGTGAHLDVDELRLWTALVDASRIIDTELEAQLVTDHGMSHREYEVLVRIDGGGGSKRMSELAREIEASAPLVSQTVARLEQRGWVARRPAAADGRGVDATLTTAGRGALATAAEPHAELVRNLLLQHVPAGSLGRMADLLTGVADHLRLHRAGGTCGRAACVLHQEAG